MPLRTEEIHRISRLKVIKEAYAHILFNYAINDSKIGLSIRDLKKKFQGYTHLSDIIGSQILVDNGLIKSLRKGKFIVSDPQLRNLLIDILGYRRIVKDKEGSEELRQIAEEYDMLEGERRISDRRNDMIDKIKTKHASTLKEYSFLRDVIQTYCPLLYPEIPYRDLLSYSENLD